MLLLLKMLTLSFSISRYFFCKSTACFHLPQSKGYGDIDFLMEFYATDSNTTYLYTIFHIQTYFCTYIELKQNALHSIKKKRILFIKEDTLRIELSFSYIIYSGMNNPVDYYFVNTISPLRPPPRRKIS